MHRSKWKWKQNNTKFMEFSKMDNLGEMNESLEKYNLLKLNQEEKENLNRSITEIETSIKNLPTDKSPGWLHRWILPKCYRRANTYPIQTLPENCRARYTPSLILWGHHHPNIEIRQACHRKRKLQANITDEHRCKNTQHNSNK